MGTDAREQSLDVNPERDRSELAYTSAPVFRAEHGESRATRLIEQQAAKVPSHVFLFLSLAAMSTSLAFELAGRQRESRFIGMWPGPLLVMGVYTKLVKTFGAR